MKWNQLPRHWPFVRGLQRSPVNSPHKGQWGRALMFSLLCAWKNGWVENGEVDDLRSHRAHYDVIVMKSSFNGMGATLKCGKYCTHRHGFVVFVLNGFASSVYKCFFNHCFTITDVIHHIQNHLPLLFSIPMTTHFEYRRIASRFRDHLADVHTNHFLCAVCTFLIDNFVGVWILSSTSSSLRMTVSNYCMFYWEKQSIWHTVRCTYCVVVIFRHHNDVIMGAIASLITSLTIVYTTVYSCADRRTHQSSVSLVFARGIHRWPVNSPHKWPVKRKKFQFWWRHHWMFEMKQRSAPVC